MWIRKIDFINLHQRLASATTALDSGEQAISQLSKAVRTERELTMALHHAIDELHERLIEAEGAARGAKAISDSLILRTNQLQQERDQLFTKLFNPDHKIAIATPKIVRDAVVMPPGVDFEDIGDESARREGYDVPLRDGTLTELLGQVYDPAADAAGSPTDVGFVPPQEPPGFSS